MEVADVVGAERIAIDAPAHGDSAESPIEHSFGAFAAAVVELLAELDIGPAIFGGISMGAGISLRIARDYPDLVTGLILVRPAWIDQPGRPHLDLVADVGGWIADVGPHAASQLLFNDTRYQAMVEVAPASAASVGRAIDGVALTGRPDVLVAMVDSQPIDSMSDCADISQPAVVVKTEADPLHPTAIAAQIADALPQATLIGSPPRYLDAVGHQECLTAAINSFLAEHCPATETRTQEGEVL